MSSQSDVRALLRHLVATLSFRFAVSVNGAPTGFGEHDPGQGAMTPIQIVRHLSKMMRFVRSHFDKTQVVDQPELSDFEAECERFQESLAHLDESIAAAETLDIAQMKTFLQGPLADALTHIGQLAMLRRLAGSPVEKTNFLRAEISSPSE